MYLVWLIEMDEGPKLLKIVSSSPQRNRNSENWPEHCNIVTIMSWKASGFSKDLYSPRHPYPLLTHKMRCITRYRQKPSFHTAERLTSKCQSNSFSIFFYFQTPKHFSALYQRVNFCLLQIYKYLPFPNHKRLANHKSKATVPNILAVQIRMTGSKKCRQISSKL